MAFMERMVCLLLRRAHNCFDPSFELSGYADCVGVKYCFPVLFFVTGKLYVGPGEFKNISPMAPQLAIKTKCFVCFFQSKKLDKYDFFQPLASVCNMSQKCSPHGSVNRFLHDYTYNLAQKNKLSHIL